ncbi:hypothetical protein V565_083380 [Rhizoctonia solani 123E]|uniref:Uncharacterized protein n=1 Tax=Rhizoctonia solani 123E TaxID=1423351 RepID=A0A074RYA9_9AGAM|nr:hypothetical protein V565_083380 [Rhizoctonia solani 123E]
MTIDATEQMDNAPVQVDLGNLAATVALASEALEAAVEGLTGAAMAVTEANRILGRLRNDLAKLMQSAKHADSFEEPDSGDEVGTDEGSQGQINQNEVTDQGSMPRSEFDDPVNSASLSESPGEQIPASQPQAASHDADDDLVESSEVDDTHDALPSSPVATPSRVEPTSPIQSPEPDLPVSNNEQWDPSRLLNAMKSHLLIPPGWNYIHLDQSSDALAFIAYMALQANRIICIVPDYRLGTYAQLLKSLTHASIHRLDTPEQFKHTSERIARLDPSSFNVFFTPYSKFIVNAALFQLLSPDCILHWDQPASAYYYVMLTSLVPTMRTCVMVIGEDHFNGEAYGVEQYSDTVLDACFSPNSPFQLLCQVSSELLPEERHPVQNAQPSGSRMNVLQSEPIQNMPSSIVTGPGQSQHPHPLGHYYIVLDNPRDKDIIAFISYVALNSVKVICHIPKGKNLALYQRLISLVTNISVITSAGIKNRHLKVATRQLKSERTAVLLRTATPDWYSFLSGSLVDSVIHWGVPRDLTNYVDECRTKVQRSYLILTMSQYSSIQWKLDSNHWIQQHPHLQASEFSRQGSWLNDLRTQVARLS